MTGSLCYKLEVWTSDFNMLGGSSEKMHHGKYREQAWPTLLAKSRYMLTSAASVLTMSALFHNSLNLKVQV